MNSVVKEDLDRIIGSPLPWKELEGKTVVITGANGFLPAYLVRTLLYLNDHKFSKKVKVIGLVRNKARASKRFFEYRNRKDLKFIVQDVCKDIHITEPVHYIIHAASQASPKYYGPDPVGTLSANIIGTRNLLELARIKKVKSFLFISSGEVYGILKEDQIPTKEKDFGYVDPTDARNCYAESKRMGENMCVSWFSQYKVPAKIARPFHTYGPGMDLKDGRVFADFVSNIVNDQNIIMKSDGSAIRAFCYLSDATLGFFTVLLKGSNGSAYNIGDENGEICIIKLAELLVGLFPEKNLSVVKDESKIVKGYMKSPVQRACPDISRIKSLGWEPKVTISDGFERTIISYGQ